MGVGYVRGLIASGLATYCCFACVILCAIRLLNELVLDDVQYSTTAVVFFDVPPAGNSRDLVPYRTGLRVRAEKRPGLVVRVVVSGTPL